MKPSVRNAQLGELYSKRKSFCANTITKRGLASRWCINWPAILDLRESGDWTELPFLFRCSCMFCQVWEIGGYFHDGILFVWRNKWSVRCHVMGCARDRNGSFVVLRGRPNGMVERKVQGIRCVRGKRNTWSYQSYKWVKLSVRDHRRAQMVFIAM